MITIVIPTLNEAGRIGAIVDYLKGHHLIDEIIVIDDGSTDETAKIAQEQGAKVYLSSMLGKGASMADGLRRAHNDIVLFLDGDIYNFSPDLVDKMVEPLLDYSVDFVKGAFKRQAGRVTELTAKPLLKTFFPELTRYEQPLGGIIAGRRSFLEKINLENDYAVDIALLIDIHQFGARIAEVQIGHLEHDHQSLSALSGMAFQIVRAILERASRYNKLTTSQVNEAAERDRISRFMFGSLVERIGTDDTLVLFDMDGTLIENSFIECLSNMAGIRHELRGLLGNHALDPIYRTEMIAKVLAGIPKQTFEQVAQALPLKPQAKETVVALRKAGYRVGIITDSYFIAAEIVRRRVFADFSIAHILEFQNEKATGEIALSPFMQINGGCQSHSLCKANFVHHVKTLFGAKAPRIISIGNGLNDVCLFKESDSSFAVYPDSDDVKSAANLHVAHLSEIPAHIGASAPLT